MEILERCPRLKTYVTISELQVLMHLYEHISFLFNPKTPAAQCEILSITDIVFKEILGAFMKQQWQDKKHVLKSLSYFKLLTEAQVKRTLFHIL